MKRQASKGSNTKCVCGSRWDQCSTLGGDLDSLADSLSFGTASAILGFSLRLGRLWDALALTYKMPWPITR
jgi:hypothetical protein